MWMLCSLEKFLPRSSLAWWALKPLRVPGKRIASTMHIWTWIWTVCQPWPPDLMQGLYDQPYLTEVQWHVPQWLSVDQFMGGSMLLSWDLMPDDSNGVAYLSSRHLGTIKASLRFPKPLLATTTLIAYAQYDNLVVVDTYRSVTFDYNAFDWQLQ